MRSTLALLLMTSSLAIAAKKPKPQPPSPVRMHDEVSQTGNGTFTFTNLVLSPNIVPYVGLMGYKINGSVTNNSAHAWEFASFKLEFLDSAGNPMILSTLRLFYRDVKVGDSKALFSVADYPVNFPETPVGGFRIAFDTGKMAVAYKFHMTKPAADDELLFDDTFIKAGFVIGERGMEIGLLNKTDAPLKIDWNQASIVDSAGTSHPISHQGIKYADAGSSKPPTTIPPTAKMMDTLIMGDSVQFRSGDWDVGALLQQREPAANKGATLGLFLPIEVNGTTKNYMFQFQVADVIY